MLLLPLLLLSLASISSTKNATLPSSVVLVTPANGTAVNSSATVGLLDQDPSATGGYLRNVTFFISFPNGTSALIGNSFPMTCAPMKDNFTEFSFDGGAPGVYTLTANVDYGLPSGMNCSSPFHYQSLNVSESWTLVAQGGATKAPVTETQSFATQPTGVIPYLSISEGSGVGVPAAFVGMVLVGGVSLLV